MANTVDLEVVNTTPQTWRIMFYTVSILGFGNVSMCSWLPVKLRITSIVYHGFSLVIQIIHAIMFLVGLKLDGSEDLLTVVLNNSLLVVCGVSICVVNLWASFTKRSNACLETWARCNTGLKTNTQAVILLVCDLNRTPNCYGKTWRLLSPFFRNLHLRENLARDCFTFTASTVTNSAQNSFTRLRYCDK